MATAPVTPPEADELPSQPPLSVLQRRWRKFRRLRRGWWSFCLLLGLYALSFATPVLINDRALAVRHEGEWLFPAFGQFHEATRFGQRKIGEADYRALAEQFRREESGNLVVMPPYPYHPNESLLSDPTLKGPPPHAPSRAHWFGTDDRARDVFARLAYGFRISISFALCVVGLAYLIGMTVGACLGFFGGKVDIFGQRLVEIWAGIPFLYTVIIISSLLKPKLLLLAIILALFSWVGISFYMRGEFYREKAKDYVAAAISQGESSAAIMFRHVLPNGLTPIISFAPFAIVGSISALVSLDFLGFGLQPPTPSWGELVNQGLSNINDWHLVVFPLGALFVTLQMVVFIGESIREAFDPKVFSPGFGDDVSTTDPEEPLLRVEDLRVWFDIEGQEATAVSGVSFDVRPNEFLGIVGESGSGKSVTALSILRLIPDPPGRIAEGRILFQGEDLLQLSWPEMRAVRGRHVAMIFQEPMTSLNPVFPIGMQVAESLKLHEDVTSAEAQVRAAEVLERVGIPDAARRLSDYPHQFSGGMRQRVMIAMALICRPALLIADEPTTALDVTIQAQILDLMKELQAERDGASVMLITHDLAVVAETCDRVIVMYGGRIQEVAPIEELFEAPQHPYTRGLLNSIPHAGNKGRPLEAIPGNVPSILAFPPGCKFCSRCPEVMDRCRVEEPALVEVRPGHAVRCHLVEESP